MLPPYVFFNQPPLKVIFLLTHRGPRVKLGIYNVVLTFKIAFVGHTVHNSDQGGGIHPPPSPYRVKKDYMN